MSDNDDLDNIPVLTDVVEAGEEVTDPVDKVLAELPLDPLDDEPALEDTGSEPLEAFSFETVEDAGEVMPEFSPDPETGPETPAAATITSDQLQAMITEASDELREALLEDYQQLVQETLSRELDKLLAQYRVTLTERLSEQLNITDSDAEPD